MLIDNSAQRTANKATVLSYLVQIVVLSDQLLQLGLDVDNVFGREFKLHDRNTSFL